MTGQPVPESSNLAATVLARDARRVRVLTGVVALLWVVAVGGLGYLLWTYYLRVIPRLNVMERLDTKISRGEEPVTPDEVRKMQSWTATLGMAVSTGAAILAAAVVVLALAMLGTLVLLHLTRRATMRQIQAGLADISAQLAELRRGPAG